MNRSHYLHMPLLWLILFGTLSLAHAETLHLLTIIDTGDENIGTDVAVDMANVITLGQRAAEAAGLKFNGIAITSAKMPSAALKNGKGKHTAFNAKFKAFSKINFKTIKKFNRKTVTATIKDLKVGSNDVLWTHYAGHGFRWETQDNLADKWPALDLGGWASAEGDGQVEADKSIQMSTVAKLAEQKGARLVITIADSCNEVAEGLKRPKRAARGRGADKSVKGFARLFKNARGQIRVASTQPGELAWGDSAIGGVFTFKFIESVIKEANKGDESEWENILKVFKGKSISMLLATGEESDKQHPQVEYTVTYGKANGGDTTTAQTAPSVKTLKVVRKRKGSFRDIMRRVRKVKALKAKTRKAKIRKAKHKVRCREGESTARGTCIVARVDVNEYDKNCAGGTCRCAIASKKNGSARVECITRTGRCGRSWTKGILVKRRGKTKVRVAICSSQLFKLKSRSCRIRPVYKRVKKKMWGFKSRKQQITALKQNKGCAYVISSKFRSIEARRKK
jgi:hypothetical protein